jgi:hypothetical protein
VLGVDRHRTAAGQFVEVDAVDATGEGQVDALMHEAVAHQTVAHPGAAQQVDRALLENPGLDRLLDGLSGLDVDDHRVDTALIQQVRQQQPGRTGSDDSHLGPHHVPPERPLPPTLPATLWRTFGRSCVSHPPYRPVEMPMFENQG